jgi:hypothetical protein
VQHRRTARSETVACPTRHPERTSSARHAHRRFEQGDRRLARRFPMAHRELRLNSRLARGVLHSDGAWLE